MAIPLYGQNKDGDLINEAAKDLKQIYRFGTPPNVSDYEHPVAAQLVDGTAGDTTLHQYADGFECTLYPIVAQDNDAPAMTTTGADYGYEQDDDDGIEWRMSDNTCKGREGIDRFTVGRQAFSAELELSIEDVTGTDDCAFGFAKVEAHQAAIDNRDEMAVFNIISGVVNLETILNGGGTTTTDTTLDDWGDNEIHSLKVSVDKAGAVTYKYDGAAPTVVAAFSFDIGEVVTPSFYLLQAAHLSGAVIHRKLTIESDNGSMEA